MPRYNWSDDGYFATDTRDLGGIRRVLVVTMLLNFVATAVKLAVGLATGALSVVADALDSLFDGISNVVGLAGMWIAAKPPDAEHPYGHRKFETVAALSISFLLFITSWQLLSTAWARLREPQAPQVNLWTGAAMVLAIFIQLGTSLYELRAGRRMKSEILVADALHTRASILVSMSVLFGLGLVRLGFPQADPLLAAFVALVIAKIGVDILRENLPVLVDQATVDPRRIAGVASGVQGVKSIHRVRSRGAVGSAAVDLHVRIAPEKTVQEANAIGDEVRRQLLDQDGITDVTVHLEPQRLTDDDALDLFATLKHAADGLGLTIHEARAHRLEDELHVEIHVGVDPALSLGEAHSLVDRLEAEARQRLPQVAEVHTHIEMAERRVEQGGRAPELLERSVRQAIESTLEDFPALSHPHNLLVRRDPEHGEHLFISLELTIDPATPIGEAHYLSSLFEDDLRRRLEGVVDVLVHLEPVEDN
jgi:cation diffusion facilitator family transporter